MTVFRLGLGVLLCAVLAAPGWAQMPPGPDLTCLCLQQQVNSSMSNMQAANAQLSATQAQLTQLDGQLAAARAGLDVNNPQAVAQFRQLLAQRDTAYKQSTGGALSAAQAATASYDQAVAGYNNQCAGRPLPPPPPGPLSCALR
jgi:hypothetical protein